MAAEIDRLEIQVQSSASKANQQLDLLISRLDKVSGSLSGINAGGMRQFASGMNQIASSSRNLSSVKSADINRIVKNLSKLSGLNTGNMFNVGNALKTFSSGLSSVSGVPADSISNIVSSITSLSKLGNKGVQNAISNMPALSNAINSFMSSINNGASVNQAATAQITALSSAIATFGRKTAQTAINSIPQLGNAMNNLFQTLSKMPAVSQNTIQMTNALANLASQAGNIKNAANSILKIGANSQQSNKNVRNLSGGMNIFSSSAKKAKSSGMSLARSFGMFYANCFLLIRGFKKLGQAIESSMDYVETFNYFNVTMDKIGSEFVSQWKEYGYSSADAYQKSFSGRLNDLTAKMTGFNVGDDGVLSFTGKNNLSLNPEEIMNYQANIASMTNSLGLCGETSVNTAKALSMLAADMSSLRNVDLSTVMTNFQSGIMGQSRALYKYGIDITNATLQTYAYKYGIQMAVSEMTQADKMQLRLLAILDQSKVAWGDQANTINSVANQYRILKQQVSNLARIIGNLFIPILQKALPAINGFVMAIQRLFVFIGNLLGIDWKKSMDGITKGYTTSGDAAEELADSTDDVGKGIDKANEKAKKLQRTILGFDEINKLNDNTGESGNTSGNSGKNPGSGGIDLSGDIADALADYESVWNKALQNSQNKAQEYADNICKAFGKIWKTAEPTRKAIKNLWDGGLKLLGNFTWGTIKDFWNNFLKPIGAWALSDNSGLPRFFNITNKLLNEINWSKLQNSLSKFYSALQKPAKFAWNGLMGFYDNFLRPVASWTMGTGIPGLVDALTKFINKINWEKILSALNGFWKALAPFAKKIGEGLLSFIEDFLSIAAPFINIVGTGLINALTLLVKILTPVAKQLSYFISAAIGIKGITKLFGILSGALKNFNVVSVVLGKFKTISGFMKNAFSAIGAFKNGIVSFGTMMQGIFGAKSILAKASTKIGSLVKAFLMLPAPVKIAVAVFAGLVAAGIAIYKNWDKIKAGLKTLEKFFKKVWANIKNQVKKAVDKIMEYVEKVKNIPKDLKKLFKNKIEGVEEWFSGIKDGFVDTLKNLKDSVPDMDDLKQAISDKIGEISAKVEAAVSLVKSGWKDLKGFVGDKVEAAVSLVEGIGKKIEDFGGNVTAWVQRKSSDAIRKITEWSGDIAAYVQRKSASGIAAITEWSGNISAWVQRHSAKGIRALSDWGGTVTAYVKRALAKGQKKLQAAFGGTIEVGVKLIKKGWKSLKSWIGDKLNVNVSASKKASGGILIGNTWKKIQQYAAGGLPNQGQMFIAREAGPELVGTIGGHSSVMNNNQIVASVSDGVAKAIGPAVYNAVVSAMKATGGKGNITITLAPDSKGLFKVVKQEAQNYRNATGLSPFPV